MKETIIIENYPVKLKQISIWGLITFFAITWKHDSYQALIAISSALVVYFIVLNCWRNKASRFFMFLLVSMTICQTAVTIKKAIMDEGFESILKQKPFGVFVGDIVYGFDHIFGEVIKAFGGIHEAINLNVYTPIEELNYRFITLFIMWIILSISILIKPSVPLGENS
jgi:hypothetical protein